MYIYIGLVEEVESGVEIIFATSMLQVSITFFNWRSVNSSGILQLIGVWYKARF